MAMEELRYDLMVETALRRVVHDALQRVAEQGLPGNHHFYISFLTEHPGVQLPAHLHRQYPKEMTIVLQYQYYGLTITNEGFSVMLSFNSVKERLVIPFAAITTFADPSVNFALQFQTLEDLLESEGAEVETLNPPPRSKNTPPPAPEEEKGVVINLDTFRKKPVDKDK